MDGRRDVLLEGVVGSTAYGLAGPGSDIDYAGIYVEPTRNLLGLRPPQRLTRQGGDGADATYHEIGKAMRLMLSCNSFDTAVSVLPPTPDEAPLDDLLQRIRRAHLDSPEAHARSVTAL
ncbi:DNA polymerase beta superfamily protein [Nocardia carnea]|uniref:DNA polymerase beta superfamily protein n=1 Tax=Nocardia carnea TaxID=37328 RepID=UPI002453C451|nr:nucleotidyltransferase domain-containing protein [Nocardia carnea]